MADQLTPFQQAQLTLTEGFPGIEANVIQAVMVASKGDLEAAFNGLLSMTDPEFKIDESLYNDPKPQQPVSARQPRQATRQKQVQSKQQQQQQQQTHQANGEPVASFFEEDLPEIKEKFSKGFNETKTKVNSWLENFRKEGVSSFLGPPTPLRKPSPFDDDPEHIDVDKITLKDSKSTSPVQLSPKPVVVGPITTKGKEITRPTSATPESNKISLKAEAATEDNSFLTTESEDDEEEEEVDKFDEKAALKVASAKP